MENAEFSGKFKCPAGVHGSLSGKVHYNFKLFEIVANLSQFLSDL